jgi:hypothetical protein
MNITAVKGSNIGWLIYANDSEGKWNNIAIQEYLVRNSNPYATNPMFNSSSIQNGSSILINVIFFFPSLSCYTLFFGWLLPSPH